MAKAQPRRVIKRRSAHRVRPANQVQGAHRTASTTPVVYSANGRIMQPFKFLDDVRAAGLMRQFIHLVVDVGTTPGLARPFVLDLMEDIKLRGFQQCHVTLAERIFQGHRAMLVQFNKFLPEGYSCSVPPEEVI